MTATKPATAADLATIRPDEAEWWLRPDYRHADHQAIVPLPEWHDDAPGNVSLDEELAGLIQALWRLGLPTIQSCQGGGHRGNAWISFEETDEALDFIHLALRATGDMSIGQRGGVVYVWFPPQAIAPIEAAALAAIAG